MAGRFFKDTKGFADILTDLQTVVSGSSALHLLLPSKITNWTTRDLDIYVPNLCCISQRSKMQALGHIRQG